MAKSRKRQKRSKAETGATIDGDDRLSMLPESLMLRILFLLPPVDALRTSILSNTWRRLWNSIPTQSFKFNLDIGLENRQMEKKRKIEEFIKFVDDSLEKLKTTEEKIKIHTLTVHLNGAAFNNLESHVNRWMRLLAKNYIKELDIVADYANPFTPRYNLPETIFNANSLSTLKIEGFWLPNSVVLFGDFNFPCLQKLSLSTFEITKLAAEKLLSSTPVLKQLDMKGCVGLEDFSIPNLPKLSIVKLSKIYSRCLAIQASNVEVLHYPIFAPSFNLDWLSCENLKELSLKIFGGASIKRIVEPVCSKFYFLETLSLEYVSGPPIIEISNRRLKSLSLSVRQDLDLVKIYAPNLKSYTYKGWNRLPSSSRICASKLQTALCSVALRSGNIDTNWFLKLTEYITMFKHQIFALQMSYYEVSFNPKVLIKVSFNPKEWTSTTSPFVPNLDRVELKFKLISPRNHDYRALLNGLLWSAHPRILSVRLFPSNRNFIKFLCGTLSNVKEIRKCRCKWKKLCWRHLLKDVKIKTGTYDRQPKDLQVVEGKSVFESLSTLEENEHVMFELTW